MPMGHRPFRPPNRPSKGKNIRMCVIARRWIGSRNCSVAMKANTNVRMFFATSSCFDSDFSSLSETQTLAKGLPQCHSNSPRSQSVHFSDLSVLMVPGGGFAEQWRILMGMISTDGNEIIFPCGVGSPAGRPGVSSAEVM